MKMTDADRAALINAWNTVKPIWPIRENDVLTEPLVSIYVAGKRAGAEDMRERAARVAETADAFVGEWKVLARVGAAIRALGVDDD